MCYLVDFVAFLVQRLLAGGMGRGDDSEEEVLYREGTMDRGS